MNPAVEGHSYDLTCSVEGTAAHIYWMRNGEKLHSDNRTLILNNNMTIRFRSIHRNDTEEYQCMAINIFGNMTSMTFRLLVKCKLNTTYLLHRLKTVREKKNTTSCQCFQMDQ